MATQYIAIERADDVFESTMKPYKKWYERIYMSPLVQYKGKLYRIISTLNRFNQGKLRKVLICTKHGEVIQSEKLSQQIFKVLIYLHYYKVFAQNIFFDEQQRGDGGFSPIKKSLKQIQIDLLPYLSNKEKKVIVDQLNYYRKIINALNRLAIFSKKCLEHIETMEQLTAEDMIDEQLSKEMNETIIKRGRLRGDVEALIIQTLHTRKDLEKLLKNKNYKEHISNAEDLEQVTKEINNANRLSASIIEKGRTDWKFYEQWLGIDKGEFTLAKFASDLAKENEAEKFIETNINIITKNHWVHSADLKY